MSEPVLVGGATGKVGSRVVHALSVAGLPVRALVRDERRGRAVLGPDVELAIGDLADPRSLAAAIQDVRQVLVLPPERHVELAQELVSMAATGGVECIVRISAIGADARSQSELLRAHAAGEAHLAASGVPHVHVRCNSFFQNLDWFAPWVAEHGSFASCGGAAAVAWVDARDVSDVAAAVLVNPDRSAETLEVTGGAALTAHDIAAAMAHALNRPVGYTDLSPDKFHARATAAGWDDWIAREWGAMYGSSPYGTGEAGAVTDTVLAWTGRPPRTIDTYLAEVATRIAANHLPEWVASSDSASHVD